MGTVRFMPESTEIRSRVSRTGREILTPAALGFVAQLQRDFNPRRLDLLAERQTRQATLDAGTKPAFLPETQAIRDRDWRVGDIPRDLLDRRVEITGPVDRKMIINALNSGACCFMADFEDSCSPTWANVVDGQVNLRDAVDRSISYSQPETGKKYELNEDIATLIVRPRGWHLDEKHVWIDGAPVSASLFDFGLYLFNNADKLMCSDSGPYFYLPKLENHKEAILWNDVILAAEDRLGLKPGTVKVTVLIETILAAFEMDEILHALREHCVGLNCGRWDYIFSFIKKFRNRPDCVLPDRSAVTMQRHFLSSYVELLVQTCHRRGAFAMGGMAAQIPIKDNPEANETALQKVRDDKIREARAGCDGTWIAHPGLLHIAMEAFSSVMKGENQLDVLRDDVTVTANDLLKAPKGVVTKAGFHHNIRVGVRYLEAWLRGHGCVPLYHLMEDAATAEICRAQLWQWLQHETVLCSGDRVTTDWFEASLREILNEITEEVGDLNFERGKFGLAAELFGKMVRKKSFDDFLTVPAYEYLD